MSRGLTLVEVMVTLALFVFLAWMALTVVREAVKGWTSSERRRVLYERAAGALDRLDEDLTVALCREPPGVDEVKVRFIGYVDPNSGQQQLMFVRSFEAGPERALTSTAGDGRPNELRFRPPGDDGSKSSAPPPAASRAVDKDFFTGQAAGDFRALGGMAQVAYFVENQTLYRAIRAPVESKFALLLKPQAAVPVSEDVLYLAFDYWTQKTQSWDDFPPNKGGPEKIWDSTRGLKDPVLQKFFLHQDGSENDPEDDVFPMKVRVTLCVDSPLPRCVHTQLLDSLGPTDGMIYVDSTQGFSNGGTEDAYLLIDKEWIHFKKKTEESFVADLRGARGTLRMDHGEGALVRTGQTFRRTIFLSGFREESKKR